LFINWSSYAYVLSVAVGIPLLDVVGSSLWFVMLNVANEL